MQVFFNTITLLCKHDKFQKQLFFHQIVLSFTDQLKAAVKNCCQQRSNPTFCIIISAYSAIFSLPSMIIKCVSYSFSISHQSVKEQIMKFFSLAMNMTLAFMVQP